MLERIENAGPRTKARRLVFADGLDPRTTSAAAVKELQLEPGPEVTRSVAETRLRAVEPSLAKTRALQLLGYREHSAHELRKKLTEDGYPAQVTRAVVERLCEVELVDDRRFAEMWTRSRLTVGYGTNRIQQELVQRGIEPEFIDAALEACGTQDEEIARARRALGTRTATDRKSRDRLLRRLISRGFPLGVARAALDADADAGSDTGWP